jgi:cytoskeletal protein CcmA (bactofilin family)
MSEQTRASAADPTPSVSFAPESEPASIGPTIVVRGEIGGDEDLTVNGRIEGNVSLAQHRVVIGPAGRVHANVHARQIEVHGTVEGDLRGDEQVTIRSTGNVIGNISAPQVSIEPGSRFRGSIDMDVKGGADGRKGVNKHIMMAATDRNLG